MPILSEFLDWDLKNHIRIQDFDLNSEVYYKFKKCLLFAKKYIESQNFEKLYDFCLGFYFEKDSKGKIQDFMSQAYNLLFKALLVVFVIACLIYYSFAYYIYLDYASVYQSTDKRKKKAIEYDYTILFLYIFIIIFLFIYNFIFIYLLFNNFILRIL